MRGAAGDRIRNKSPDSFTNYANCALAASPFLADVLVVAAGRDAFEHHIVDQLNAQLRPETAALMKEAAPPDTCAGVVHLMAATGLERPIVFLLGLDDLATEETNPLLSPEERRSKAHDHTRLIYVGLTRAIEKLVIYSSHPHLQSAFGAEAAGPE